MPARHRPLRMLASRWAPRLAVSLFVVALLGGCAAEPPGYEGPYRRQVRAAIPKLEEASGLAFQRLPVLQDRSRDEVRGFLEAEMQAQLTPLQLAGTAAAYRLFGLLPDTLDLRAFYLDLLTEQVAGYYDPATKVLYVVEGAAAELRDVTITHELMHALQDQHVRLDSIKTLQGDNDRMVAMQAVVEGQATYEQLQVMTGGDIESRLPGGWGALRETIRSSQEEMPQFAAAPMFLQETLLFPYLSGAEFVRRFSAARAGRSVLVPFAESTEQILHPEKFLDSLPDRPTRVRLGAPRAGTVVHEDNLGEFETRLFLFAQLGDEAEAVRGAAGWDGDRYQVVSVDGAQVLGWLTVWDDAAEAEEFATRLRKITAPAGRRWLVEVTTHAGRPVVLVEQRPAARSGPMLLDLTRATFDAP